MPLLIKRDGWGGTGLVRLRGNVVTKNHPRTEIHVVHRCESHESDTKQRLFPRCCGVIDEHETEDRLMNSKISLPNGQEIAYDVRERGTISVIQLHGLTSSRARDEILGLDFTADIDGVRAARYDAPGHGESPVPSVGDAMPADFSWPRLAEVLEGVMDSIFPSGDTGETSSSTADSTTAPTQHVVGIGQSMGAATLLTAAARNPERFAGLVLIIPPTIWEVRGDQAEQYVRFAELIEQHGMSLFRDASTSGQLPPAIDPERPDTDPDVDPTLLPTLYRGAARTNLPPREEIEKLDIPVLILAWTEDPAHPLWSAEALAEALPNAELEVADTPSEVENWPARMEKFIASTGR